jgi:Uma2 family endonuclease
MTGSPRRPASLEDFWAIPEAERFHELIGGEIVPKATPSGEHGVAQAGIVGAVHSPFQRAPGGGGRPGGWWIAIEVLLDPGDVVRPDVLGWRRDRCPERPTGNPVRLRPDWLCEVISPSNANHDTIKKLRLYQRVGVPNYWLVDSRDATLTVALERRWIRHAAAGRARRDRAARAVRADRARGWHAVRR